MVVNAREAQILERQMPELLDSLVDTQLIVLDLLQQFFYLFSLNISPVLIHSFPRVQKRNFAHPTGYGPMNCLPSARASNPREARP
jgi:hypothetical protein